MVIDCSLEILWLHVDKTSFTNRYIIIKLRHFRWPSPPFFCHDYLSITISSYIISLLITHLAGYQSNVDRARGSAHDRSPIDQYYACKHNYLNNILYYFLRVTILSQESLPFAIITLENRDTVPSVLNEWHTISLLYDQFSFTQ